MAVFEIREAQREGARLVIGLQGMSGSGKTRTALELAYGLAGFDSRKIGFIDTENRRGSLYADCLRDASGKVQPFMIGDLTPPFSPQRYIDAIEAFERAGVDVLVIDSGSHEWAGQGGCFDIANAGGGRPDWLKAKGEHKRFMNVMLQSPMHIIVCIREAPKMDFKTDPKKPTSLGLQPIQEGQFVFELTASLQMWNQGKEQVVLKCPEELLPILGREQGYITPRDGKALRDWVDGGKIEDPQVAKWRGRLNVVCEQGETALAAAWKQTPDGIRSALGDGFYATALASAQAFDQQRKEATGNDGAVDDLNSQLYAPPMGNRATNDPEKTGQQHER